MQTLARGPFENPSAVDFNSLWGRLGPGEPDTEIGAFMNARALIRAVGRWHGNGSQNAFPKLKMNKIG